MKLLRQTWFKIMISILGGGMASELIHISTGDPNRPKEFNPSVSIAVILFVIITLGIYLYDYYKVKSESE